MKEKIRTIFNKSMAIKSFTHTAFECDIERFLTDYISDIPYFKKHPDQFGTYTIPHDSLGRSVNWALVGRDTADTVILFHHHDTVDTEDFGHLKDIAFDNEALKVHLSQENSNTDVLEDIASNEWQFGRGSCDMKAALALQLGVLEEYAQRRSGEVNLLYLSVGDEEAYSQGMRAVIPLLAELKERFNLHYILAVDSEPFESPSATEKVLHVGTVGKLMPLIVTQGILSHIKEPLKGINAISLLAKIVEKIDLNPQLADQAYSEHTPLPSWSFMRDLKEQYDVSTVLRATGYFSLLYLDKSPQELLATIKKLSQEALDEFYDHYCSLQMQYQENRTIERPKVLTYQDLLQACQKKPGFTQMMEQVNQASYQKLQAGLSYQEVTLFTVQKVLDFYDKKEALAILAIAPPYYPSMNSRRLQNQELDLERLISLYQDYLERSGDYHLKVQEYFMGICDMSYCALEKPLKDYRQVLDSLAVSETIYPLDLEKIAAINVASINLGPWGKDLHQRTERVYEQDMLETIPQFFLYLLEHFDEVKKSHTPSK